MPRARQRPVAPKRKRARHKFFTSKPVAPGRTAKPTGRARRMENLRAEREMPKKRPKPQPLPAYTHPPSVSFSEGPYTRRGAEPRDRAEVEERARVPEAATRTKRINFERTLDSYKRAGYEGTQQELASWITMRADERTYYREAVRTNGIDSSLVRSMSEQLGISTTSLDFFTHKMTKFIWE